jgi:hypothetical protein
VRSLDAAFYRLGVAFLFLVALTALAPLPVAYDDAIVSGCGDFVQRYPQAELWGPDWRGVPDGYVCVVWGPGYVKLAEHRIGLVP